MLTRHAAAAEVRLYQAMLEFARMVATCRREHGGLHLSCAAESHLIAPTPATGPKHRCLVGAAHSRRGRSG